MKNIDSMMGMRDVFPKLQLILYFHENAISKSDGTNNSLIGKEIIF